MATTATNIHEEYPIPVYRFTVTLGDEDMAFSEVAGLDIGNDPITYKDGLGVKYMPGQETPTDITLKRGIVKAKSQLFEWIDAITLNLIDKKDITISLTNEVADTPIVTWTVKNAFPKKLAGPSLNAATNDVSIETLEMRADSVAVEWV
jgi:phage tail-like protein